MRITLHNEEINRAIKAHILAEGITLMGKDVDINIIAGRGTNGTSAEVDINASSSKNGVGVSAVPTAKTKSPKDLSFVETTSKHVPVKPSDKVNEGSVTVETYTEPPKTEVAATSKSLFG